MSIIEAVLEDSGKCNAFDPQRGDLRNRNGHATITTQKPFLRGEDGPPRPLQRICLMCETPISRGKYCSPGCRQRAYRQRRKAEKATCPLCGENLQTDRRFTKRVIWKCDCGYAEIGPAGR